jgi:hypothetical protein
MNFITKLWRGEYSLAKTYWLFNFLIGAILGLPISVVGSLPPETLAKIFLPSLIYFIVYILYIFIVSVGLWRSASKNNNADVWKFFAKAFAVISIATIVVSIGFLAQSLLSKNFSLGNASYKFYACQNIEAQTEAECEYKYVADGKYFVYKEKSEVFLTVTATGSNQQNISKLGNCVVIDTQNWQCSLPNDDKLDSSGSGLVMINAITRSNNGAISISDAYLLGVVKGKPMTQKIIKANKVEKN